MINHNGNFNPSGLYEISNGRNRRTIVRQFKNENALILYGNTQRKKMKTDIIIVERQARKNFWHFS